MKVTCGTDIVEIDRIKESIETVGDKFLNRVYTKIEQQYIQKYQHYAARFAAKEAVFKAISVQLKDKYSICWKDVEVINNEQGRPEVNVVGVDTSKISYIDISISHCKSYATANVVICWN